MRRKKSKGFTLLEVVVATIIVSVGLVPIMKILPTALQVSSKVEIITKCTFLAERKMEEVRANAFYNFRGLANSEDEFDSPDDRYWYRVNIAGSGDLRTVTVTVWLDDENSVVLETKIADRG